MYDLQSFTFTEMVELGSILRKLGQGAESMEGAANRIVRHLYDHFTSKQNGSRTSVLVRLFKTHPFGELDAQLRQFAQAMLGGAVAAPAMKCLVLLATAGERSEWNSRARSNGHKAIPLPSEKVVQSSPMISQLLSQLGLSAGMLLKADSSLMLDAEQRSFNVFHVPQAEGSPHVPAQKEFVIPYGVKSVLGFGGLLPPGELFVVILFTRAQIRRETAELFKTLALSTKLAIVPFVGGRIFASSPDLHAEGRIS